MTPQERLIENIHMIASKRRVTRAAMAEHLHVQVQTVYRRMDGTSTWPTNDLVRLAAFLEVDISVLFAEAIAFTPDGPVALTNWYAPTGQPEAVA
jgi:hypothetical protein